MSAGVSAILLGLIDVGAFVNFAAFFSYPASGTAEEKMRFLSDHQPAVSVVYFSIYVLFGMIWLGLVILRRDSGLHPG